MGYVRLVLGALGVILASSLWRVVVHLILKPYAITRTFRNQGVEGPRYKFWSGSLEEIKGMKKAGREMIMENHIHDIIPRVMPHYLKWLTQHAFGSSYAEGMEVFLAQQELEAMALATILGVEIPGLKYLPTKRNVRKWKLERRIKDTLMTIIQGRLDSNGTSYGIGLMMEACRTEPYEKKGGLSMTMDEIIDECKTFFFAGYETTSHLLTWTMFLLSINQEWQERLREEVLSECGTEIPSYDMLGKLKLVTMVLHEVLRLYSPVISMQRMAAGDMNLRNLMIPKGTGLTIPIAMIYRNKEFWGDDANKFNPMRFENGIAKAANHPNAYLTFSVGPRACVGQNFAMLEAKTVLAMILQRFSFSLSPNFLSRPITSIPQLTSSLYNLSLGSP